MDKPSGTFIVHILYTRSIVINLDCFIQSLLQSNKEHNMCHMVCDVFETMTDFKISFVASVTKYYFLKQNRCYDCVDLLFSMQQNCRTKFLNWSELQCLKQS